MYIIISNTEYLDTKQWKCPIMKNKCLGNFKFCLLKSPAICIIKNFIRLEPKGLDRTDGKCPDGITMVPWKNRNLLVWGSDSYAPSHLAQSTMAAGAVASQAEDWKKAKYLYLEGHPGICFTPIAYETSAVVGLLSLIFLKELGHRLSATTCDTKSYSYLVFQWLYKGAMLPP